MSRVLTARDVCARALRLIGKYPVTQSAPDGESLREAMHWLDLILAELTGTERVFDLVPDTLTMPITNGTSSYSLYSALGADLPKSGIFVVVEAWLQDSAGNRSNIEITGRRKFEDVCRPGETGTPKWAHIDRLASPTIRIYPTPAAGDPTVWSLKLVVQRLAPTVAPEGVTGDHPITGTLHELGQAWQRWLVFQLAHDLGAGAIMKLPEPSLNRFAASATLAKGRLLAVMNREHETTPPIVEPWGMS